MMEASDATISTALQVTIEVYLHLSFNLRPIRCLLEHKIYH